MYRVAEDYPQDIADADYPLIRQFKVPAIYNFKAPKRFRAGSWSKLLPINISGMSACSVFCQTI